ncbi:Oxidoreductase, short-chain dehydrogenase/reductase family [Labilithrix luteola]|uniref:Oxidoreductase, short-chain dehydrogenase/reductase family n=1 Tax=Labilithrix luteola TaxID=1391654 RepID=A0A0K1PW75_9BACT|nr:SDR family NAD(P)-dependent oxidoreductase [Labilithrix luteola]AKU97770.1 Oxidoreductase, short-chain dehydrogenase/reductase family [Labilithrix luteola]
MKLEGNTILVTGGGSGIGRALAEAFHARGNQVIVSGRRRDVLETTVKANPGMDFVEMDVSSPESITAGVARVLERHPSLDVLVNNAGIMKIDDVATTVDDELLVSTVATNLLGPMRMTGALVEHFKNQPKAAIINVSSALGFVPLSWSAVYSSTKAAMHSYSLSLRYKLKGTRVEVIELAPPWVQTDLLGPENRSDARAMPLDQYMAETMSLLERGDLEVVVERAKPLRNNVGPDESKFVNELNDMVGAPA